MRSYFRSNMLIAAPLLAFSVTTALFAQNTGERKPTFSFSLAMPDFEGQVYKGPLFERAVSILNSTHAAAEDSFANSLAPDAVLTLRVPAEGPSTTVPLTAEIVRAAHESCLGPYSFDEGRTWVQLSWICRVDGEGPLGSFLTFGHNPELSLTIWFDGDKIKKINAMEPIPVPGQRRLAMNAFELMKDQQ